MQPRKRNQRGEGANLRLEVIEAAMRVLDRSPTAALSLRTVAREAGVAAPSVYSQFPDAKAMLTAVARECWRQIAEAMSEAAQAVAPGAPLDRLKAEMGAYVRYAMERPSRYQLLFAVQVEAEDLAHLPGLLQPAYRRVLSCVEDLASNGASLPADDLMSAVLHVISLAHGRVAIAHLAPNRPGNSAQGVEAFVLRALERTFRA